MIKKQKKSGVSIFESLIVIAAILILVSITFPVLRKVKETGRKATCLSNLYQYGIALKLYENDSLFFPRAINNPGDWDSLLDSLGYLKVIGNKKMFCPTYYIQHESSTPAIVRTYALARRIFLNGMSPQLVQTTDITYPNTTILLAEVNRENTATELPYCDKTLSPINADRTRHMNGSNYLFFDFHVHWHKDTDNAIKWSN
ncbi:hypothetical protein ACFL1T_00875 [Chlamydiota bacterium]